MRLSSDSHQQVSYSTNNEQDSPEGNATVAQENGATLISSDEHQYCFKRNFHQNNQQTMFANRLQQQSFCDITIARERKLIHAHKVCSLVTAADFES